MTAPGKRFYVGQPVICVNDRWGATAVRCYVENGLTFPFKNRLYHVRSYLFYRARGGWMITLEEIANPVVTYDFGLRCEAGFMERRFEPRTEGQVQDIMSRALRKQRQRREKA